jgi:hypothetical protein
MRELIANEQEKIGGGPGPLVVLATVLLVAEAVDVAYNAAKAFKEGYQENDKV